MSPYRLTVAHRIVGWALSHRVTVAMGFLALVVLGGVSYWKIPLQFMPTGFTPPYMGVFISYPNANAREVDDKIADPVTAHMRTIRGVKNVRSRAFSNGCYIFLEFHPGTDMDAAYLEIRTLMERLRPDLPDGVDRYRIWKFNPDDEPVMFLSVAYPSDVQHPYRMIETLLQAPILRIPGVGRVEINGLVEPQLLIELHQDAVERHRIRLLDLIRTLRADNFSIVSGHIDQDGRRYYIRSTARWRDVDEIARLRIHSNGLRLKDIADVRIGTPELTSYYLVNDREGVTLEIYKEAAASSVAVSRRVRSWLEVLQTRYPELAGWHMEILFDEGQLILQSISDLQRAGLYGGILAALILWFFLRNLRMTLFVAAAIPLSLTMTLVVMYFAGETLNLVTMMGLMLAVGMVVDNAVVVVESIDRYRLAGHGPREAAYRGTTEVGLAILTATGTTLVVFVPLILLQENAMFAFYFQRLGFPVIVSLVASLVVAMVFTPVGSMQLGGGRSARNRIVEKTCRLYQRVLARVLSSPLHRTLALGCAVLIFASTWHPLHHVRRVLRSEGHVGDFRVIVEMPPNVTLEQSRAMVERVIRTLLDHRNELFIRTLYARVRTGWSVIRVFLKPKDQRPLSRDAIIARARRLLPEIPGVQYRFGWRDRGGASRLQVSVYGRSVERLEPIMRELALRLERIPEVVSVELPTELRTRELHIHVEDWLGQRLGVHPLMVAQSLAFAVRGLRLWSTFPYEDDYINLQVIYRKSDRSNLTRILDFKVPTERGTPVPIRSVAQWRYHAGIGQIERENGRISLPMTLGLTRNVDMPRLIRAVRAVLNRYPWPSDYGWRLGSMWRSFEETQAVQTFALLTAIGLVFLLMGTLFESVVLPFCVLFSIPFALVGVYWMLYLTHTPLDLMAGIGMVILMGIVVNNAIVLIDRVNQLRKEGRDLTTALIEGGGQRFRPIWMTALTTVMGMTPMALGQGELVGISYAPLARAVIGGLLVSTFVTLFLVPLMYHGVVTWQTRLAALIPDLAVGGDR